MLDTRHKEVRAVLILHYSGVHGDPKLRTISSLHLKFESFQIALFNDLLYGSLSIFGIVIELLAYVGNAIYHLLRTAISKEPCKSRIHTQVSAFRYALV